MNIFIFSVSIGNGHDQVAKTLKKEFMKSNFENKVKIINVINLISPVLDKVILDGYLGLIRFYPKAWGKFYEKTNKSNPKIDINDITNKLISSKIKKRIIDFQPDVIICTHSLSSSLAASLREKGVINCPLISIITDFSIHSSYINKYTDYYIIAHESLIDIARTFGLDSQKVLPFGIPIELEFSKELNKDQLIKKFNINKEKIALVMGGGLGLGEMYKIVKELDSRYNDICILAVTGHNTKLEKSLKKIKTINELYVFGFIENIYELMEISDFIISKPGGVTCAEVISKEKPLIIYSPLPGQESDNSEFLLNHGFAVKASSVERIHYLIDNVLSLDLKIKNIKEASLYLKKPNAAIDIVNFIRKMHS